MNHVAAFNPRRIDRARLEANLSVADVAFGIRRVTNGRLKPTEQSVRRWVRGLHTPREGVVAAIAAVTGHDIAFFYESDDDEEEDPALRRDLQELPIALRRRVERALARKRVTA